MIPAQTFDLAAHVGAVGRHLGGHLLPRHHEHSRPAVTGLGLAQDANGAGQQGVGGPGGAPQHGGDVGAGAHGAKVLVPLFFVHVLGLVGLQQDIGGGAHDPGGRRGGEEQSPGAAHPHGVARLAEGRGQAAALDRGQQPVEAVLRLGMEGGRRLDQLAATAAIEVQAERLHLGGHLILARLARHHHGQGQAAARQHRGRNGPGGRQLVAAQRAAQDVAILERLDSVLARSTARCRAESLRCEWGIAPPCI